MTSYSNRTDKATCKGEPIYIETPRGRQCVGVVSSEDGHRVWVKTGLSERKHFCRKYSGWGQEVNAIEQASKRGAELVRIITTDTKMVWEAALEDYRQHGKRDTLGDFGPQLFLSREYFTRQSLEQGTLFGTSDLMAGSAA